jgi:hypothetical protein
MRTSLWQERILLPLVFAPQFVSLRTNKFEGKSGKIFLLPSAQNLLFGGFADCNNGKQVQKLWDQKLPF